MQFSYRKRFDKFRQRLSYKRTLQCRLIMTAKGMGSMSARVCAVFLCRHINTLQLKPFDITAFAFSLLWDVFTHVASMQLCKFIGTNENVFRVFLQAPKSFVFLVTWDLESFCFLAFITFVLRNLCFGTHRRSPFF